MDHVRLGARYRALRHRLGWRQRDLADRCGVSQGLISLIERGHNGQVSSRTLDRVAGALDAEFVGMLRWRGGDLDRLLDEDHAHLLGAVAAPLARMGWLVQAEVTYAVYGERGSIDLLAWHAARSILLVIEIKTEIVSIEETLRKHDEKARLAPRIAAERFGWRPGATAKLLVLPATSTARRRVDRHAAVMRAAYSDRLATIRTWIRDPIGPMSGVLFEDPAAGNGRSARRRRIRRLPEDGPTSRLG